MKEERIALCLVCALAVLTACPALNAQDLGELLQRAGAVEGMQMDINPAWMKFDYYQAKGKPSDPTPVPLLPTQQPSPYSYYTPSTRDFTAVYAR